MGKKKTNPAQQVTKQAQERYQTTTEPTAGERQAEEFGTGIQNQYNQNIGRQMGDYGNIMDAYSQFRQGLSPTTFGYRNVGAQNVKAMTPKELKESYGYLREAMPGYREFAETGGYSPTDVQEMRARGMSPIRSAYGNTMMELDRARSLGGGGGAPNYIAALSRAQRELPEQMASAMTDVNATLARDIRQGRQFGLQGITGTGATMGGLSSQDAQRQLSAALANQDANLRAALANQGADLQAQGMGEQSRQNMFGNQLASLSGQANLFGTTPGMANMFGNQALNAMQQRGALEQMRNQFGLGLMDAQMRGYSMDKQLNKPWWQTALNTAGQIAPYALAPFTGGTSLLAAGPMSSFGSGQNAAMMGQGYNQGPLNWGGGGFQSF